jgi:hypothetical protein
MKVILVIPERVALLDINAARYLPLAGMPQGDKRLKIL